MTSVIILVLLFVCFRTIFFVMWYGKSIIKPDFERVDLYFSRKRSVITNWDTPFGKRVYYTFVIIILLLLSLMVFDF
jgi:hypothetical protein